MKATPREVDVLIGFIGLETSHPFSDARNLCALDPGIVFVVSGAAERVDAFVSEHETARIASSARSVIEAGPDLVVVSVRPSEVAPVIEQLAAAGVPAFVNKLAATTNAQVDALLEAAGDAEHLFLTSSVLRFAPMLEEFKIDRNAVLAVNVILRHDVGWWEQPDFAWQDASDGGGGLLPVMGIHAFEVLAAIFGPRLDVDFSERATRTYKTLMNGDVGQIAVRVAGGVRALITLLGVSAAEKYEFVFHTAGGSSHLILAPDAGGTDPLGYLATAQHIMAMAGGAPSPVPLRDSAAVLRSLAAATDMARRPGTEK